MYEKHTWQAGDIITSALLNNIEGGGRGSSKSTRIRS